MNPPLQDEMHAALGAVLQEMQQRLASLIDTLQDERAALVAGESLALDRAGARKYALMLQLEQLDAERQQLSRESGPSPTLDQSWSGILQTLQHCNQLNLSNGHLVNQRLLHVRRALSVLTGHSGDSGLYGDTGSVQVKLPSRVFAQA